MQFILFEDDSHFDLRPFSYTRPVFGLRVGIDTLQEKWERTFDQQFGRFAYGYLGDYYNRYRPDEEAIWFNGKFIPDTEYVTRLVEGLEADTYLLSDEGEVLAARCSPESLVEKDGILDVELLDSSGLRCIKVGANAQDAIRHPYHLFQLNGKTIRKDFEYFAAVGNTRPVDDKHSIVYGADNILVEEGVKIRAAVLNAEDGPIYLGKGANIQEGAMIHGTHAICDHATLNMGAKMRGDTTVGPWSKVGGEIGNSVIQGFSNKGHDGYLGNSVLGYWCNLGADTNTSNLKNNYSEIRLWNYRQNRFVKTGAIFCGLMMGDHSKCGINTMFNTGTVVGVSANIFGDGYPRNFIPSFTWGGAAGFTTYRFDKAMEVAGVVMKRRNVILEERDKKLLQEVFNQSARYRPESQ